MRQFKPGAGFAIFILFFGIALLESFQNHKWMIAIFWLLMGSLFILLDTRKNKV